MYLATSIIILVAVSWLRPAEATSKSSSRPEHETRWPCDVVVSKEKEGHDAIADLPIIRIQCDHHTAILETHEDEALRLKSISIEPPDGEWDSRTRVEAILDVEQSSSAVGASGTFRLATPVVPGLHLPHYNLTIDEGSTAIFRGAVDTINVAFGSIEFIPQPDFHGELIIHVLISEVYFGPDVDRPTQCVHEALEIRVKSVDDPPELLWRGVPFDEQYVKLSTPEDTTLRFERGALRVEDNDNPDDPVTLTISNSARGRFCYDPRRSFDLIRTGALDALNCSAPDSNLTFSAPLDELNRFLGTLVYQPTPANWWGYDEVVVSVASGDSERVGKLHLVVNPVDDEPLIEVQGAAEGDDAVVHTVEDGLVRIPIFVSDSDCDPLHEHTGHFCHIDAVLTVISGMIEIDSPHTPLEQLPPAVLHEENTLHFRGAIDGVNLALANLVYRPRDFSGNDRLTIEVITFLPDLTTSISHIRSVGIVVSNINHPPLVSLPGNGYLVAFEDVAGIIGSDCSIESGVAHILSCDSIKLSDPDANDSTTLADDGDAFVATVECAIGNFHLPGAGALDDIDVVGETSLDGYTNKVQIRGSSINSINTALHGAVYLSKTDFNSDLGELDRLTVTVEDQDGESTTSSLFIRVEPVNDFPAIVVAAEHGCDAPKHNASKIRDDRSILGSRRCQMLQVKEDTPFDAVGSFSIMDVDIHPSHPGLVEVDIRTSFGSLSVADDAPVQIWIVGSGDESAGRLRFQSGIDYANEVLQTLKYHPLQDYAGHDDIRMSVSDLGNSGDVFDHGGTSIRALTDEVLLPVWVVGQQDNPSLVVPDDIHLVEDSSVVLQEITITHPDATSHSGGEDLDIFVSIECDCGTVKLSSLEGLNLSENNDTQTIVSGEGSIRAWNRALFNLTFTPFKDYHTDNGRPLGVIQFSVANVGANTTPMQNYTEMTTYVEVAPVNDKPEIIVPGRKMKLNSTGGFVVESVDVQIVDEDIDLVLGPISIVDVDIAADDVCDCFVTVNLETSAGTLRVESMEGLHFFERKQNDGELLSWQSTIENANKALSRIVYRGASNFHGHDAVWITVNDEGNSGVGGALVARISIPIHVLAVPDSPKLRTPDVVVCGDEEWCDIMNCTVWDPDSYADSKLHLLLDVGFGRLSFAGGLEPQVVLEAGEISGDQSYHLVTDTVDSMNAALRRLAYLGSVGSHGKTDTIHLVAWTTVEKDHDDETTLTAVAVGKVHIVLTNSMNNGVRLVYTGANYQHDHGCNVTSEMQHIQNLQRHSTSSGTARNSILCDRLVSVDILHCFEDSECPIGGITVEDAEEHSVLEMSVGVQNGGVFIKDSSVAGVQFFDGHTGTNVGRNQEPQTSLIIRGTKGRINAALESLFYVSHSNFVGTDQLDLFVGSMDGSKSDDMRIEMVIANVDDPPRITGIHEVLEMTVGEYITIPRLGVVYADSDVGEAKLLEMEVVTTHGTLVGLGSTVGLDFLTKDGETASSYLASPRLWFSDASFYGKLSDVNKAIKDLAFTADEDWDDKDSPGFAEVELKVRRLREHGGELMLNGDDFDDSFSAIISILQGKAV